VELEVEELINSMTEEDARREKVQEVYESLSNYEEIWRLSLLGLAIWSERCLNGGGLKFESMQEIEDLWAMDEAFDPAEYKREC
jgi:hypothetical protein